MKQILIILVILLLFNFICLSLSQYKQNEIVYKRYHRRRPISKQIKNKQSKLKYVEEIKEVFKTILRPPLYGSSDAAIERFFKCDNQCNKNSHIKSKTRKQHAMKNFNTTAETTTKVVSFQPTFEQSKIPIRITSTVKPEVTTIKLAHHLNKTTIPTFSQHQITIVETPSTKFKHYLNKAIETADPNEKRYVNLTNNLTWTIPEISVIRYNNSMVIPSTTPLSRLASTTEFNWSWLKPNYTTTTNRPKITSRIPMISTETTTNSNDDWLRSWFKINSVATTTELSTAKYLSTKKTEILSEIPFTTLTTTVPPSQTAMPHISILSNNFDLVGVNNNKIKDDDDDDVYDGDDDEDDDQLVEDDDPIEETVNDSEEYEDDYETNQLTEN